MDGRKRFNRITISITRFDSFEFFTVDYGYSKSFVCDAYYTSSVMHIVVNLQIKCYLIRI